MPKPINPNLSIAGIEKYVSRIRRVGDCWEFGGARQNAKGYKAFCYQYNRWAAHRVSYSLVHGEIPEGLVIDHLCRNTVCVNPRHLEAVTNHENVIVRGIGGPWVENYHKTECPYGHPYDEENTRIIQHNGQRSCKQCETTWRRARYEKRKEAGMTDLEQEVEELMNGSYEDGLLPSQRIAKFTQLAIDKAVAAAYERASLVIGLMPLHKHLDCEWNEAIDRLKPALAALQREKEQPNE